MNRTATTAEPATTARRASIFTAVLRSETRLYLREPSHLLGIAFPPALLVVLGSIPMFREAEADLDGLRVIDLYVPVVVLIALATAGIQALPPVLTSYRELGVLRRMSTTPVRPSALLAAQVGLHGAAALLSALLSLAVGRVVLAVALPGQVAGYLVALLLAAVACLSLGALIAALSKNSRHAGGIGMAVYFPALFCTGLWIPVRSMPDVLADIVGYTPFGAAAGALDQAAAGSWPDASHLVVIAGWGVVTSVAAVRWFRWE